MLYNAVNNEWRCLFVELFIRIGRGDVIARCPELCHIRIRSPWPYSCIATARHIGKCLRQELDQRAIGIKDNVVEKCLARELARLIEYKNAAHREYY